jgi:hypothetical protein
MRGATPEGITEKRATAAARTGALNAAIQAQLAPEHAEPLGKQIETAQNYAAAKDYVAGITPASPAPSHGEVDEQYLAAIQENQADHASNPKKQKTVQHVLDVKYNLQRRDLDEARTRRGQAVQEWLAHSDPEGQPQADRPPPALWNQLTPGEQDAVDARLAQNARDTVSSLWPEGSRDRTSSPSMLSIIPVANARDAYSECVAICSQKYADGLLTGSRGPDGSNVPSLMRICIRACLAERDDHNY